MQPKYDYKKSKHTRLRSCMLALFLYICVNSRIMTIHASNIICPLGLKLFT